MDKEQQNCELPSMKMVLDNLKQELCRYFSVQEISGNIEL